MGQFIEGVVFMDQNIPFSLPPTAPPTQSSWSAQSALAKSTLEGRKESMSLPFAHTRGEILMICGRPPHVLSAFRAIERTTSERQTERESNAFVRYLCKAEIQVACVQVAAIKFLHSLSTLRNVLIICCKLDRCGSSQESTIYCIVAVPIECSW